MSSSLLYLDKAFLCLWDVSSFTYLQFNHGTILIHLFVFILLFMVHNKWCVTHLISPWLYLQLLLNIPVKAVITRKSSSSYFNLNVTWRILDGRELRPVWIGHRRGPKFGFDSRDPERLDQVWKWVNTREWVNSELTSFPNCHTFNPLPDLKVNSSMETISTHR